GMVSSIDKTSMLDDNVLSCREAAGPFSPVTSFRTTASGKAAKPSENKPLIVHRRSDSCRRTSSSNWGRVNSLESPLTNKRGQFQDGTPAQALASVEPLLDLHVDSKCPVVIPQRDNRHVPVHVVFHLDNLLLRRAHVAHVGNRQVARNLLLHGDPRRRVLLRS